MVKGIKVQKIIAKSVGNLGGRRANANPAGAVVAKIHEQKTSAQPSFSIKWRSLLEAYLDVIYS